MKNPPSRNSQPCDQWVSLRPAIKPLFLRAVSFDGVFFTGLRVCSDEVMSSQEDIHPPQKK